MKMRRMITLCFMQILIVHILFFSPGKLRAETKVLKVPLTVQEQDEWCWAACSASILRYFEKTIKQCYIANFALSLDSCCKDPNPCKKGNFIFGTAGSIKGILAHWCVSSQRLTDSLPFSKIKEEIQLNRPLIIRWSLASTENGHFLIIRGYRVKKSGKNERLYLVNPWAGEGYGVFSYDYVWWKSGHHTWTHTLKKIKLTKKAADWTVTHSSLAALKTTSGFPYWRYNVQLKETRGGCGKLIKFHIDHYDEGGGLINRETYAKKDFADWFTDCGDGDFELPRKTKFCCDGIETHLGGKSSGSVKWSFEIACDKADVPWITVSKEFSLPAASGASGMTYQGNFGKAETRVSGDLRKPVDKNNSDSCECCKSSSTNTRISPKGESK